MVTLSLSQLIAAVIALFTVGAMFGLVLAGACLARQIWRGRL